MKKITNKTKVRLVIGPFQVFTTIQNIRKNYDSRINAFIDLWLNEYKSSGLGSKVAGIDLQVDLMN